MLSNFDETTWNAAKTQGRRNQNKKREKENEYQKAESPKKKYKNIEGQKIPGERGNDNDNNNKRRVTR